jgi:type I restriction enzyme, R subunit
VGTPDLLARLAADSGPRVYDRARVAHQQHQPIAELIARHEDGHLEKKSTFRWDIVKGEKSKAVETATLKTIAAFLNDAAGGTLLIGVPDRVGDPLVGLEPDFALVRKEGSADVDRFEQVLRESVINAVGAAASGACVSVEFHTIDDVDICRVHAFPSAHPVYASVTTIDTKGQHQKAERFYVRQGNSTREITDENEIQKYVAHRWSKGGL